MKAFADAYKSIYKTRILHFYFNETEHTAHIPWTGNAFCNGCFSFEHLFNIVIVKSFLSLSFLPYKQCWFALEYTWDGKLLEGNSVYCLYKKYSFELCWNVKPVLNRKIILWKYYFGLKVSLSRHTMFLEKTNPASFQSQKMQIMKAHRFLKLTFFSEIDCT